jgi:hypothetical protein
VPLPDHTLIFIHLVKNIVANLQEPANFFALLEEELADAKSLPKSLTEALKIWSGKPDDFAWTEDLDEKTLAGVVHLLYMGLCELSGPVSADESFHKAIASCAQRPESRRFSAARFL